MKKYPSKIDTWLVLSIAILLGITGGIMIVNHLWGGLAVVMAVAGFVTYIFTSICYRIDGHQLMVSCGFLFRVTVPIDKIRKIAETDNALSAPAGSLDRIAIYYNTRDSVMVSPKDKMGFIHQLKEINPMIIVVLKSEAKQKKKDK